MDKHRQARSTDGTDLEEISLRSGDSVGLGVDEMGYLLRV